MKLSAIFIICILFICACTSSETSIQNFERRSVTINLHRPVTFSQFSIYSSNGQNYLCLFDAKTNSIEIIEIETGTFIKSIKLSVNQNKKFDIGNLKAFYVHNFDSIFTQHLYSIAIIDTSGAEKYFCFINKPELSSWPEFIYNNAGGVFPMSFDNISNSLFIRQYSGHYSDSEYPFYYSPVEAFFNLRDSVFISLPVKYPIAYTKSYYGDANYVFREVNENLHIYSFMGDPDLIIYDITKNSANKIEVNKKGTHKKIQPIDTSYKDDINKKVDHLVESPLYMKVLYDKYRKLYYRFFLSEAPLKNNDGSFNTFNDKDLLISILDDNFRLVREINIGKGYFWFYSFVTSDGLYVMKNSSLAEVLNSNIYGQSLQFDVIRFNNR